MIYKKKIKKLAEEINSDIAAERRLVQVEMLKPAQVKLADTLGEIIGEKEKLNPLDDVNDDSDLFLWIKELKKMEKRDK